MSDLHFDSIVFDAHCDFLYQTSRDGRRFDERLSVVRRGHKRTGGCIAPSCPHGWAGGTRLRLSHPNPMMDDIKLVVNAFADWEP